MRSGIVCISGAESCQGSLFVAWAAQVGVFGPFLDYTVVWRDINLAGP